MDEKKQIEEMAKTAKAKLHRECFYNCITCAHCVEWHCAVILYNAGYRKQSEGEWIKQTKKTTSSVKGNEVEYHVHFCSECGYEIGSISYHHKFCQNCGAKMKNAGWRDDAEAEMKGV